LDPQSADAYDALGMMQAREAQWVRAESSFRRAVGMAPRDALWHYHFAIFLLMPLGRMDESLTELRIAEELDPGSPAIHSSLTQPLAVLGRVDEADSHCQRAAENDQQRSVCWNRVLQRLGRADESIQMLEANLNGHLLEPGAAQSLGVAYAHNGRRLDAERMAALAPRLASKAQIFTALGDKDRTFEVLDQMVPMGPTRIGRDILNSPNFDFLHGDPRLKVLRNKVGLPE
jgi:tetratricopeptide (TPR) repeat protein